jgi:hypothetical protein
VLSAGNTPLTPVRWQHLEPWAVFRPHDGSPSSFWNALINVIGRRRSCAVLILDEGAAGRRGSRTAGSHLASANPGRCAVRADGVPQVKFLPHQPAPQLLLLFHSRL